MIIQTGVIPERTRRSCMDGTPNPDQRRLDNFGERTSAWLRHHINGKTHCPMKGERRTLKRSRPMSEVPAASCT